ncbi:MAG: aminopeptidase [Pseudonocardiales bacterium]|nr:aminopeptidase [Pseudonocardiales bacterium]
MTTVGTVTSLTRDAARSRADLISVHGYDLRLDLMIGDCHFGSVTTVRFVCGSVGAATFVDVAAHELRSASLNGRLLDLDTVFDATARRITLDGLQHSNELVVDAVMAYSHDGEGLHRHVDPADGRVYVYAMSFLDAAPRWYACFDQPDLKAPVTVEVRCPSDWLVVGNGPATEVDPGHWGVAATGPLATYFTTFVAGPYHQVRDSHDGIPLSLLARQSLAEHLDTDAKELFAHTKRCLDALHRLFGARYPWGEYHQAFVPEFNAGAMENPGCVTFRDTLVFRARATEAEHLDRKITIAHEMAHMWFGDLVTMRWWDDLWLNESFAEYLGSRVSGEQAWVDFGIARKSWGFAADRRPSTHPVAGNGAADAASALTDFDGISYAKGASVLRQLARYLGDDVFLGGLRRYIERHANGNAEFADLAASWSAAGANDLDAWLQAWLRTSGLDELSVAGTDIVRHSPSGTPRTHAIAVTALAADGRERSSARITVRDDRTPTGLPADGFLLPDAADESWAKLVLTPDAWAAMPTMLVGIEDTRSRVAIWNALQLAVADAEVDPALAMDIVSIALPAETDDAVIGVVGRWARRTVAGGCLSEPVRQAALARVAGAMLAVVEGAEPSSGRQLAAARIVIGATSDARRLRAWLDGTDLPPGLLIDTELRWSILHQLALLGDLGEDEIGQAAVADRSSHGAVHVARCRAARPDDGAKREAWAAIMGDADRPNYELYALAEGFWEPDHRHLTDAYVPRYFDGIAATAELRSGWVVDRLALLAYPWTAVCADTVARTDELLEDQDLHSGIRRSIIDAGDDLRRALVVRERFAG